MAYFICFDLSLTRGWFAIFSTRCHTNQDRQVEESVNPVEQIMQEYVGTGPYSLLYRLHGEKRRARVMIRRVNRYCCTAGDQGNCTTAPMIFMVVSALLPPRYA